MIEKILIDLREGLPLDNVCFGHQKIKNPFVKDQYYCGAFKMDSSCLCKDLHRYQNIGYCFYQEPKKDLYKKYFTDFGDENLGDC